MPSLDGVKVGDVLRVHMYMEASRRTVQQVTDNYVVTKLYCGHPIYWRKKDGYIRGYKRFNYGFAPYAERGQEQ